MRSLIQMRYRILISLVYCTQLFGLAASGCYPEIHDGHYSCDPAKRASCPPDFVCRMDPDLLVFRCFTDAGVAYCGDGIKEGAEACDGLDFASQTCLSEGFIGGQLRCSDQCRVNTVECFANICGDGVIDGLEECDINASGSLQCTDFGGAGGALGCTPTCLQSASGCQPLASCGNGQLDSAEVCDGTDLGGETCLSLGLAGGDLFCDLNCTLNTAACLGTSCGNGVAEVSTTAQESCDGSDLRGMDCAAFGLVGSGLLCSGLCRFDLGGCDAPSSCGNDNVEGRDYCDGGDLNGGTCLTLGYTGGDLQCNANCSFDVSDCQ